ncbi:hypothetical protein [Streptomyces platensis]|uniref:hypothetical protein n=1 Tax=Streptomyces platensis TaxID=58346 RepID=UPI00386CB122|nr:hypothetical protein OG962_36385 [Streptomyces platensis]
MRDPERRRSGEGQLLDPDLVALLIQDPDDPRGHPNFPRHGLLRYAEDPNPRMRQLAPDDPESTLELVERFSRDSAPEVRLRAATDPRLTTSSAVRMLDDPHEHIRHAAARHPTLPVAVMRQMMQLLVLQL